MAACFVADIDGGTGSDGGDEAASEGGRTTVGFFLDGQSSSYIL